MMGGMGVVYPCFDHEENRPVALKTFKKEFLADRAVRDRFLRECDIWVSLGRHTHIVQAYGIARVGNGTETYLVLELVAKEEGRVDASLRSYLIPGQPLGTARALGFALQIVRGVAYAAATIGNFVHRDLKPENVLVGADRMAGDGLNRLRVTDFGLVQALTTAPVAAVGEVLPTPKAHVGLTRIGSVLGTPSYMAPEQWMSANVDEQADIYAVGCILGEMLIGRPLVEGRTLAEFHQAHREGRAQQKAACFPSQLREVLDHCLAVVPAARYANWTQLERALSELYTLETGLSLPESNDMSVLNHGERVATGWAHGMLGLAYKDVGDTRQGIRHLEEHLTIARNTGDRWGECAALANLAASYPSLGNALRATECCERAMAITQEVGDRQMECAILNILGFAYGKLGDVRRAIAYHEQALVIALEIGDRRLEGSTAHNLGSAYSELGDSRRAIEYFEKALAIAQETGNRRSEGGILGNLGGEYGLLNDVPRSIKYLEQHLGIARELCDRKGEGAALHNLGIAYSDVLSETYDAPRAVDLHKQALLIAQETGDSEFESNILGSLGNIFKCDGNAPQAMECYQRAMRISQEVNDLIGLATNSLNLAYLLEEQGQAKEALPLAQFAAESFARIGNVKNAKYAEVLVAQLRHPNGR